MVLKREYKFGDLIKLTGGRDVVVIKKVKKRRWIYYDVIADPEKTSNEDLDDLYVFNDWGDTGYKFETVRFLIDK